MTVQEIFAHAAKRAQETNNGATFGGVIAEEGKRLLHATGIFTFPERHAVHEQLKAHYELHLKREKQLPNHAIGGTWARACGCYIVKRRLSGFEMFAVGDYVQHVGSGAEGYVVDIDSDTIPEPVRKFSLRYNNSRIDRWPTSDFRKATPRSGWMTEFVRRKEPINNFSITTVLADQDPATLEGIKRAGFELSETKDYYTHPATGTNLVLFSDNTWETWGTVNSYTQQEITEMADFRGAALLGFVGFMELADFRSKSAAANAVEPYIDAEDIDDIR